MFPGTLPVSFSARHLQLLHILLEHPEGILQSRLPKMMNLSKGKISVVKSDLAGLGYLVQNTTGNGNEFMLKIGRRQEAMMLVRRVQLLGKCLLVRPHHLLLRGSLVMKSWDGERLAQMFTREYWVQESYMVNNRKYVAHLPCGKLEFQRHSDCMTFHLDGVVLPLESEQFEFLEEYITLLVNDRLAALRDILERMCGAKIKVGQFIHLPLLHLGVLVKSDAYKSLNIAHKLEEFGVFQDCSVPGFKEVEAEGTLDEVLERISKVMVYVSEQNMVTEDTGQCEVDKKLTK